MASWRWIAPGAQWTASVHVYFYLQPWYSPLLVTQAYTGMSHFGCMPSCTPQALKFTSRVVWTWKWSPTHKPSVLKCNVVETAWSGLHCGSLKGLRVGVVQLGESNLITSIRVRQLLGLMFFIRAVCQAMCSVNLMTFVSISCVIHGWMISPFGQSESQSYFTLGLSSWSPCIASTRIEQKTPSPWFLSCIYSPEIPPLSCAFSLLWKCVYRTVA
jgi:hypothetical protein